MVRSDQDVVNAGRQKLLDDRDRALARPRVVLEQRTAAVENRLRERLAFVDVQKGLVLGIVGKDPREYGQRARAAAQGEAYREAQRLPIADDVRRKPLRRQPASVGAHGEAVREQSRELGGAL